MDNWRSITIWFEQIPDNLQADLDLNENKLSEFQFENIKYLTLWHYKQNKLGNLISFPENLLYLQLNLSSISNFNDMEKMDKLKRLELYYCTKLQKDFGLSGLANTLEHLEINQSKKFYLDEL